MIVLMMSLQSSGDFTSASTTSLEKDQTEMDLLVKRVLVKTADLGNPARPMPVCKEWAVRISKEYFSQVRFHDLLHDLIVHPNRLMRKERWDYRLLCQLLIGIHAIFPKHRCVCVL